MTVVESARPVEPAFGVRDAGFYRRVLDNLTEGVYFVDAERRITYWNKGAERITGYTAEEVIGRRCQDNLLVHTNADGEQLCLRDCPLEHICDHCYRQPSEIFLKHRDGYRVPVMVSVAMITDAEGRPVGRVETFSDNTSKLAALERAAEMERLALIDPLTEVGNRRFAQKVLRDHLALQARDGTTFAVLYCDLDHFKQLNDSHGHEAGDATLKAAARTLMNNLRSFDFLGRWGGEEFVIVLNGGTEQHARIVAERCCGLVRSCCLELNGLEVRTTVSIGIAISRPADSVESILARADRHLYAAKCAGRDRWTGP